jgi:hypothetical protein
MNIAELGTPRRAADTHGSTRKRERERERERTRAKVSTMTFAQKTRTLTPLSTPIVFPNSLRNKKYKFGEDARLSALQRTRKYNKWTRDLVEKRVPVTEKLPLGIAVYVASKVAKGSIPSENVGVKRQLRLCTRDSARSPIEIPSPAGAPCISICHMTSLCDACDRCHHRIVSHLPRCDSIFLRILPLMLRSDFSCVELDQHGPVCLHLFEWNSKAEIV